MTPAGNVSIPPFSKQTLNAAAEQTGPAVHFAIRKYKDLFGFPRRRGFILPFPGMFRHPLKLFPFCQC
jgi:hypothetical protein